MALLDAPKCQHRTKGLVQGRLACMLEGVQNVHEWFWSVRAHLGNSPQMVLRELFVSPMSLQRLGRQGAPRRGGYTGKLRSISVLRTRRFPASKSLPAAVRQDPARAAALLPPQGLPQIPSPRQSSPAGLTLSKPLQAPVTEFVSLPPRPGGQAWSVFIPCPHHAPDGPCPGKPVAGWPLEKLSS